MNIFSISILFACFSFSLCGRMLTDMRCASIVNRYSSAKCDNSMHGIGLEYDHKATFWGAWIRCLRDRAKHVTSIHERGHSDSKNSTQKGSWFIFYQSEKFQCIGSYENETALCFFQIQASFEPFIDPNVSSIQHVPGGGGRASLECPIRAPNCPPYQYQVIWTAFRNNTKSYFFTRNFTLTSYLFEPELPAYMDNSIYTCSLLTNNKVTLQANISMVVHKSSESHANINHSSGFNTASGLSLVGVFSIYGVFVYFLLRKIKSRATENRPPCIWRRCIWPRGLASAPPSRTGIDIGPASEIQPMTTPRTQIDFEEPVPIVCRVCRGCAHPHR